MPRHRMPAVGPIGPGREPLPGGAVVGLVGFDWPSGRLVDAARPRHLRERLRGDERAGGTVEDVEEAVLGGLHQHLAETSVNPEVGQHDGLRARVVPVVGWRRLVVPDVLAGVGANGEDRAEVQVVAAARTAQFARPRRAIAGADVQQIEFGVVRHPVPRRAAPAVLPPRAVPRLRGALECGVLEPQARITWHGPESPRLLARLRVVGRHETADAELRAAAARDDLALDDPRGARDAVVVGLAGDLRAPHRAAVLRIERDQAAVERAHEDLAVVSTRRRGSLARSRDWGLSRVRRPRASVLNVGCGIWGSHRHFTVPVRASTATTTLHGPVL